MAATILVSFRCGQAMTPLSMSKLTRTVTAMEVSTALFRATRVNSDSADVRAACFS